MLSVLQQENDGWSFTDAERQMIVKTTVDNKDLPDEGYNYGNDTEDYLYVLSYREMLNTAADCDEYIKPAYTNIAMEHLAQSKHYFHLYRFVLVQFGHHVVADFCRPGEITLLHFVLSHKVPKFVITDCHDNPLFSKKT